jgi:hypothetical protein
MALFHLEFMLLFRNFKVLGMGSNANDVKILTYSKMMVAIVKLVSKDMIVVVNSI